jgi:DNA-3-methyladenine glycosylase I
MLLICPHVSPSFRDGPQNTVSMRNGIVIGEDKVSRCWWGASPDDYRAYHDHEWGFPVTDDVRLFEKICLEGFQAGLSWLTILRKRENFRNAFKGFEFTKVARFTRRDVERLLRNEGIVRHRRKIESTINNAREACRLAEEFGSLAAYFWKFEPPASERPGRMTRNALAQMPSTHTSTALSRDLKARGWSFVGPTTAYAFMQAMGLVNDHLASCHSRPLVEQARKQLKRPRPASGP